MDFYESNRTRCKRCVIAGARVSAAKPENKEKAALARKAKSKRNTERATRWRREHRAAAKAIRDRYTALHQAEARASKARWKAGHKPRLAEYARRRRAKTLGADIAEVGAVYEQVARARRIRCYWCLRFVPRSQRHVDHIIPLSKGGSHTAANLCCSCAACNLSKGAKMPEEFSGQSALAF